MDKKLTNILPCEINDIHKFDCPKPRMKLIDDKSISNWSTFYDRFKKFLLKENCSISELKCRFFLMTQEEDEAKSKQTLENYNYIPQILSIYRDSINTKQPIITSDKYNYKTNEGGYISKLDSKRNFLNMKDLSKTIRKEINSRNTFKLPISKSKFSSNDLQFSTFTVDRTTISMNSTEKNSFIYSIHQYKIDTNLPNVSEIRDRSFFQNSHFNKSKNRTKMYVDQDTESYFQFNNLKKLGYFFYFDRLEEDLKRCKIFDSHKYKEKIIKTQRIVDNILRFIKD